MNKHVLSLCALALGLCGGAAAQHEGLDTSGLSTPRPVVHPIEGREIRLTGGETLSAYPVIYLPYDGEAIPEGMVLTVEQAGTAREYPAQVHEGQFVFVPLGAEPGQEITYVVHAEKPRFAIAPKVRLEKKADADAVEVFIEDKLFTAYHYGKDLKKPFLWPVNSLDAVPVTRSYPMDATGVPKTFQDHPHHRSWWTSYGDVNGADCWMEKDEAGLQKVNEVTFGSGDAFGWIISKDTWTRADGTPVVDEEREYRFYYGDEAARLADMRVTFRAAHGDAYFKDTKEGGICSIRAHEKISGRNATITNALGDVGEENTWGKPAAWCDFSGPIEGHGVRGITIMDHPGNFRHPTSWHVRRYGLMGANPFGYSHFIEQDYNKGLIPENGDHTVKSGETLSFQYRVLVHAGDAAQAKVAERYADYATPPKAAWAE
jgi:predicted RNA-binding protein with TRAM domain